MLIPETPYPQIIQVFALLLVPYLDLVVRPITKNTIHNSHRT